MCSCYHRQSTTYSNKPIFQTPCNFGSPISVDRSFAHFLTGICAIIGGVFTVAGMIDSMVYHSAKALQKKIELGKAS